MDLSKLEIAREGICPYCGKGPYVVISTHVHHMHGLDRFEFRNDIGAYLSESLTDPDYHEKLVERGRRRYIEEGGIEGLISGGKTHVRETTRWTANQKVLAAKRRGVQNAQTQVKIDKLVALHKGGMSIDSIAGHTGFTAKYIRVCLKDRGVVLPDGRKNPDVSGRIYKKQPPWYCSMTDCDLVGRARGLCEKHYRLDLIKTGQPCSIVGCDIGLIALGLCSTHYAQIRRSKKGSS